MLIVSMGMGRRVARRGRARSTVNSRCRLQAATVQLMSAIRSVLRQMKEAIPEQAKIRMQTTLIEAEWSVPVVPYQHLGASGGVAVVPRDELPSIVARVGFTGKPTAVVVVQHPDELGLKAYPRSLVSFTRSTFPQRDGLFNWGLVTR